jgi:hypothetical protein
MMETNQTIDFNDAEVRRALRADHDEPVGCRSVHGGWSTSPDRFEENDAANVSTATAAGRSRSSPAERYIVVETVSPGECFGWVRCRPVTPLRRWHEDSNVIAADGRALRERSPATRTWASR